MKKFRHILCIAVTAGFVLLGVFGFPHALSRLWESVRDLGTSVSFYFCELFGIENNVTPTVTALSEKIPAFTLFPGSWGEFTEMVKTYLSKCISADNLKGYGFFLSDLLLKYKQGKQRLRQGQQGSLYLQTGCKQDVFARLEVGDGYI